MLQVRVIPCLLLKNKALVKTVKFKDPAYIGDPVNTVRIFNEEGVDELVFLDITATPENKKPPLDLIAQIASECFMPFAYGGGIRSVEDMRQIFGLGAEKIIINSNALEDPSLVEKAAEIFGSQSVVVSLDVKKNLLGQYRVHTCCGRKATSLDPVEQAVQMEKRGAGEILLTSIDRDGTWSGYDLELVRRVASAVNIPVIACGGAGKVEDFGAAVKAGASAVAAGSMVVYQGKGFGVLVNFPDRRELDKVLGSAVAS
jgi:cyclase